jgi:biopolymer transport protein ExbD
MSMQTTSDNASGEPMLDVNVTPLIDVMLVLLIMFIITIPIQTHAVKLDLPVNQPNQPPPPIDPIKNVLSINGVTFTSSIGSPEVLSLVVCIDTVKSSYSAR